MTAIIPAVIVPVSVSGLIAASQEPEPLPKNEFPQIVEEHKAVVKEDGLSSSEKLAIVAQSLIDTVAWAEAGWSPDSGEEVYRIMFGGAKFTSYIKHPDSVQTVSTPYGNISSAAAGKYQFMPGTWKGIYERYDYWPVGPNGETFIPLAQDLAFLRLFNETGGFYHLEKGIKVSNQRITIDSGAIAKSMNAAAATWCALPSYTPAARGECNDPRQSQKSMEETIAVFNQALLRNQGYPQIDMSVPVEGATVSGYLVTSNYGLRTHPVHGDVRMHRGTDFGTPEGTPLYAPAYENDKVFIECWEDSNGGGTVAEISSESIPNYRFKALHLSSCTSGTYQLGQTFAESGATGLGTGAHLHVGQISTDTNNYMAPMKGYIEWMLAGKSGS